MKSTQIFPTILIVLDLGAEAIYAIQGDARRAIYWTAAAILTASVTYRDGRRHNRESEVAINGMLRIRSNAICHEIQERCGRIYKHVRTPRERVEFACKAMDETSYNKSNNEK